MAFPIYYGFACDRISIQFSECHRIFICHGEARKIVCLIYLQSNGICILFPLRDFGPYGFRQFADRYGVKGVLLAEAYQIVYRIAEVVGRRAADLRCAVYRYRRFAVGRFERRYERREVGVGRDLYADRCAGDRAGVILYQIVGIVFGFEAECRDFGFARRAFLFSGFVVAASCGEQRPEAANHG